MEVGGGACTCVNKAPLLQSASHLVRKKRASASSRKEKRPRWPNADPEAAAAPGFQTDRDSSSHYKQRVRPPPIWKINNAGRGRRGGKKERKKKKS